MLAPPLDGQSLRPGPLAPFKNYCHKEIEEDLLAFCRAEAHLRRWDSPDPITRLNAALEGRYRIESEIGEGGMATVYLADDLKHERKVALKVLKPELAVVVGASARPPTSPCTTCSSRYPFNAGQAGDVHKKVPPDWPL